MSSKVQEASCKTPQYSAANQADCDSSKGVLLRKGLLLRERKMSVSRQWPTEATNVPSSGIMQIESSEFLFQEDLFVSELLFQFFLLCDQAVKFAHKITRLRSAGQNLRGNAVL